MTFLAPASRAIWMISREVVPRTIESASRDQTQQQGRAELGEEAKLTVDDENDLVLELESHSVELATNVLAPNLLSGHDEGPADVTVLDKALAIWDVEVLSELKGGDTTSVGHGDDDIGDKSSLLEYGGGILGESVSHGHASAVDRDTVEDRVGASKVDVLEDVGGEGTGRDDLLNRYTLTSDDDGLSYKWEDKSANRPISSPERVKNTDQG